MKQLILGSSGQIGNALSNYYSQKGDEVLLFDLCRSDAEDLRIENNPILEKLIYEADFVHFLAFDVGGSRYLKTYQYTTSFISNNLRLMEYTFKLLESYKKPFIFASSQMSNMLYSPYGILKALGEVYSKALGGIIVKFWNVYGIEHDLDKSHVITDFILMARENKVINMLTDGKEQRQFLHAEDCSRCLDKLSKQYTEIPRDKELHVTNFQWDSVIDIAQIIADLYPGTTIVPAKATDEVQQDKRNEPDRAILEYWKPQIDIKTGIKIISDELESNS
jgi:nucleoside-diphosphate-sugar epimerase